MRRWVFSSFKWACLSPTPFREESAGKYNQRLTDSKIFVLVNTLISPNSPETSLLSWRSSHELRAVNNHLVRGCAKPRKGCPALDSNSPRHLAGCLEGDFDGLWIHCHLRCHQGGTRQVVSYRWEASDQQRCSKVADGELRLLSKQRRDRCLLLAFPIVLCGSVLFPS